jgi:thymidylate synthase ThyX
VFYKEKFSQEEQVILKKYFTNIDKPVFALINLPEVVKGALFARYSRSPKSLRRLFLDEFLLHIENKQSNDVEDSSLDISRAEKLYDRVFNEYGDDSVAQLGGAHIACEQSSNILTKILEWGRLGSYLEQSTRYIFYDQKLGDRYRYTIPSEILNSPNEASYIKGMDDLFEIYKKSLGKLIPYFQKLFPKKASDSNFVYNSTIRAQACDVARGVLPASTVSNVGIFATGQSYELMIMRMKIHPLKEVRDCAEMMLIELRKVIPSFLKRVDVTERGLKWSSYFEDNYQKMKSIGNNIQSLDNDTPDVELIDWDEEAEIKVAAASLYPYTHYSENSILESLKKTGKDEIEKILRSYVGNRENRRHKPGRGMERVYYKFDIKSDFASFRDLQRHRLMTIDWQLLNPNLGFEIPKEIIQTNLESEWEKAIKISNQLYSLLSSYGTEVSQYPVLFGHKIRYTMQLNARAAFHLLELRTTRQGHPNYRYVCQEMHKLIKEKAGHTVIADLMNFIDHNDYDLARLESSRSTERKKNEV